ncbi:MAG: hypothetical protein IT557_01010 [Alphaproteobacteria bacterium]|nr:hypothetical protein [Alphaproteobacteria bacterium]
MPLLLGLLVLLLGAGCVWLYLELRRLDPAAASDAIAALDRRLTALEARGETPDPLARAAATTAQRAATAAQGEVGTLAGRIAATERRLTALETRPAAAPAPAAAAPPVDRGPRAARIAALEGRAPPPAATPTPDLTPLDARIATLEAALAAARAAPPPQPPTAAPDAALARLGAAGAIGAALAAGRPLGPVLALLPASVQPAPALLAYATGAPPTEAALRLDFPAAARAAREAARLAQAGTEQGLLDGALERLSGLVTIRRGDRVVLGDPTAVALAEAERRLGAGDLEGALAAAERIEAPARPAMAAWLGAARGLVAARAAVAALAAAGAGG